MNRSTQLRYIHTDHLGSWHTITDETGTLLQELSYDAWGTRRDPDTWQPYGQFTAVVDPLFERGYTSHEHLDGFGLINMNGRMYDPALSRVLSVDNYIQAPDFSQSFNRYSYCMNNPLKYTDPSGEFAWLPIMIGAAIGAYSGVVIANEGQFNPTKWNSGNTAGYMLGGALVGGLAGWVGGAIASSGGLMSNTSSIVFSSAINSMGTHIYTGGKTPVSISFGVALLDLTNNEWGYLGKKGNSLLENIGYGFGALANLADVNLLINSTSATLYTDNSDFMSHCAVVDEKGNTLMSYGPNDTKVPNSKLGFATYFRKSTSDYTVYPTLPVEITVNKHIFTLTRGLGKILPFQGMTTNCVNMASLSLWLNGIPNIGLHPYLLYATTWAYSVGIRPDLFSYYLINPYRK